MEIFFIGIEIVLTRIIQSKWEKKHSVLFDLFMYCIVYEICIVFGYDVIFYSMIFTYLYIISLKDYYTYYLSFPYLVPSILLCLFFLPYTFIDFLSPLIYVLPSFYMHRKKQWLGSVDVYMLYIFGLILGWQRMIIALFISTAIGMVWITIKKEKVIPFLVCLSIGFFISLLKGYTIYYTLISWMI